MKIMLKQLFLNLVLIPEYIVLIRQFEYAFKIVLRKYVVAVGMF